jgi:hypothetical protein
MDERDDTKDSVYEELECVFDQFPTYQRLSLENFKDMQKLCNQYQVLLQLFL